MLMPTCHSQPLPKIQKGIRIGTHVVVVGAGQIRTQSWVRIWFRILDPDLDPGLGAQTCVQTVDPEMLAQIWVQVWARI